MEGLKDMELVCWWKLQNSAFQHASSLFGHHFSSPFFITHLVHYFTTLVPLTQKLFSTSYLTKTKMFQLNFTALSPPTHHNLHRWRVGRRHVGFHPLTSGAPCDAKILTIDWFFMVNFRQEILIFQVGGKYWQSGEKWVHLSRRSTDASEALGRNLTSVWLIDRSMATMWIWLIDSRLLHGYNMNWSNCQVWMLMPGLVLQISVPGQ